MGTQEEEETLAMMAEIWQEFKGEHLGQVAALEDAVQALRDGRLDDERRSRAEHDAHRLAGSVGSFGFADASRLAKEMERFFQAPTPLGQADAPHLLLVVSELRRQLSSE